MSGEPGLVGVLKKKMGGTLDAANLWNKNYTAVLERASSVQGKSSTWVFRHEEKEVALMCRGDDFVVAGRSKAVDFLEETLTDGPVRSRGPELGAPRGRQP